MSINKRVSENYDLSISDLFSGTLFIFILLLVYFILEFQNKTKALTEPLAQRGHLLEKLKEELEKEGVVVSIDTSGGVLRIIDFDKCKSYFEEAESVLTPCGKKNLSKIRSAFEKILPCYSHVDFSTKCGIEELKSRKFSGLLDTVLIEGHTDRERIVYYKTRKKKRMLENNLHLSVERARKAYTDLSEYKEDKTKDCGGVLCRLYNDKKEIILGISGFGRFRLLHKYEKKEKNRRIDIRFIMKTPEPILKKVKETLKRQYNEWR